MTSPPTIDNQEHFMPERPATTVARWNGLHPIGTPVTAYPGCRPEDDSEDERLTTRTRSKAEVLGGHTAVVWVEGHGACIALTHVDPDHTARFPAVAVPCPTCQSAAGQLCTSHGGSRTRRHDVHQTRTAAFAAAQQTGEN
ncbi:hypothetical protein [Streptomyces sp. NPDC005780]|uniref:zinc finger domain-containing protein n=1 Tax=Streptomyces sp. NPDC005780 TaxID=3364730 RepID=UPI003676236E